MGIKVPGAKAGNAPEKDLAISSHVPIPAYISTSNSQLLFKCRKTPNTPVKIVSK